MSNTWVGENMELDRGIIRDLIVTLYKIDSKRDAPAVSSYNTIYVQLQNYWWRVIGGQDKSTHPLGKI